MVLIIICIVSIVVVLGVAAFELVGWLVERKARARFEKMTPEERFKYQNEMRKRQLVLNFRFAPSADSGDWILTRR